MSTSVHPNENQWVDIYLTSSGVNKCSSKPLTSSGDSPKLSPPSRFSPVFHLKEYLKTNIQILQDQIDWNNEKLMTEDNSFREQGTGMTPKVMVDQGTSVNDFPLPEPHNNTHARKQSLQQCIHCFKKGHTVYECDKPEKEKMIAFMHRQESLLDKYKAQRSEKLACNPQKLNVIATTRRLTNPSGKGWTTPYENLMPPSALPMKQTPQSREGNWAGHPLIYKDQEMKTGPYHMSHSAKSISTKLIQGENENGNVDSSIPPINPIYGNKRLPPHNLDKYPREQT